VRQRREYAATDPPWALFGAEVQERTPADLEEPQELGHARGVDDVLSVAEHHARSAARLEDPVHALEGAGQHALARRLRDPLALPAEVAGEGLLDHYVLAGPGRRNGDRLVEVVRAADVDQVDVGARDEGAPVVEGGRHLVAAREGLGALARGRRHRRHLGPRSAQVSEGAKVGVGGQPGPDDPDADRRTSDHSVSPAPRPGPGARARRCPRRPSMGELR